MTENQVMALIQENAELKKENARLKIIEKKYNAEKLALETAFNTEADRIRLFRLSWDKIYKRLNASEEVKRKLGDIASKIDLIFTNTDGLSYTEKLDKARKVLDENGNLMQGDVYIGGKDGGFSLSEINAYDGGLDDLKKLCEEMGLK